MFRRGDGLLRVMRSTPLLAGLHDFADVGGWTYLETVAIRQRRMLRHKLYSMIHVARLEDEKAAELFFGFCVWTIRSCHFAVLPIQSHGVFRRRECFATSPVPAGAKMFVVFKARVEHSVSFALSHAIKLVFVVVSKTEVFHLFFSSGPCSGAGKNRSSRTSPTASQVMAPLRAHASASSILAASSIQKPPMCSLVSVYGPSVTSTVPSVCFCTVFALPAGEIPHANFLTPAAIISRLSAWISSII